MLYGVETKVINRAVSRNRVRFPADFMFRLTLPESHNLKYQFGTSSLIKFRATGLGLRRSPRYDVVRRTTKGAVGLGKAASKSPARQTAAITSPINFRMPRTLRLRLRRFAKARHLAEAEALRAVISEHLDEVDSEREFAEAERWQFQQAYATWDSFRRGEGRTVPKEQIEQIFTDALAQRGPVDRRR